MKRSLAQGAFVLLWFAAAAPAAGAPILTEVFYDAVGADDGFVFVELAGDPGETLDGIVIEGVNGADGRVTVRLELSGALPADGILVVADRGAGGMSAVAEADLLFDFDLQNGPDGVVLRGPEGVLDALGYGVFAPGTVFPGEGMPAEDAPAGQSLGRWEGRPDLGDNALDWRVGEPTPGRWSAVPEPSGAGLAAAFVCVRSICRRAR